MIDLALLLTLSETHVERIVHCVYIRKNDYPNFDINGSLSQTRLNEIPKVDSDIKK